MLRRNPAICMRKPIYWTCSRCSLIFEQHFCFSTFILTYIHVIFTVNIYEKPLDGINYMNLPMQSSAFFYLLSSCYKLPWTTGEQFYVCSIIQCIMLHENPAFFTRAGSLDLTNFFFFFFFLFVLDIQCFHFSETSSFHVKPRQNISVFPLPDSCYVYSFHSFSRLTFCIAYAEDLLLKGWWFRYCILTRRFSWKMFDFWKARDFLRLVKSPNFLTKRSFTIYLRIIWELFEI